MIARRTDTPEHETAALRRTVLLVAILNLAYFGVEFVVARLIGSVSLFADSVDFLEDASINLLIFVAAVWSARRRSYVGSVLAFVILIPAAAAIWTAVMKIIDPVPPAPLPLSLTALGALAINLTCALLLVRHRRHPGSLAKAAWLSARNDVVADAVIVLVAVVTVWIPSAWFDIVAGLGIGLLNVDAARTVWMRARAERRQLAPEA